MDSEREMLEELIKYATEEHAKDITDILLAPDASDHYSIYVNVSNLIESHEDITGVLFNDPESMLKLSNKAFADATKQIYFRSDEKVMMNLKKNIHVRLYGLPISCETYRTKMPKTEDVGNLLCVRATVTRATKLKLLQYEKEFTCNKCNFVFMVRADVNQHYNFVKPIRCPNYEPCASNHFKALHTTDMLQEHSRNFQEIRIQEQFQQLSIGNVPRFMWVILEDDLVDSCNPGQDVLVIGIVKQRWRPSVADQKAEIELILKAWNVEIISNEASSKVFYSKYRDEFNQFWDDYKRCPLVGRDVLLSSICPQVYGMYMVKLAVALVLAGGVHTNSHGTKVRGDSHLLLVGDPGTGKSQFLKYAARISSRSVLTTGIGSTNAGLTVGAVKDGGNWQLEAGALVLSNGGICCIDEFNSIRNQDKGIIHEAMEQQTISVAKAGLVCKLNSQCSILAAMNPKGKLNLTENTGINLAIASPLISRFDLVLLLNDERNENWDRVVSTYILSGATDKDEFQDGWSIDKMKCYFARIKTIKPAMSNESNRIICKYYQLRRQEAVVNSGRNTVRQLESLVRLAQAHARLMFRDVVTVQDSISAVVLMESSIDGPGLLNSTNSLHTLFPEDPQTTYRIHLKVMLKKLKLDDILDAELSRIRNEEDLTSSNRAAAHKCDVIDETTECSTAQSKADATECDLPSKYFKKGPKSISNKLRDLYVVNAASKTDDVNIETSDNGVTRHVDLETSDNSRDVDLETSDKDITHDVNIGKGIMRQVDLETSDSGVTRDVDLETSDNGVMRQVDRETSGVNFETLSIIHESDKTNGSIVLETQLSSLRRNGSNKKIPNECVPVAANGDDSLKNKLARFSYVADDEESDKRNVRELASKRKNVLTKKSDVRPSTFGTEGSSRSFRWSQMDEDFDFDDFPFSKRLKK